MLSLVSRGHERRGPRNGMDYSDLNAIIKKEIGERSQRIKKKKESKVTFKYILRWKEKQFKIQRGPLGFEQT